MNNNSVGIVGYGAYIPRFRITVEEIAKVWNQNPDVIRKSLAVHEKAVADEDEDTITISVEAAKNAIARAGISAEKIGAVFIGSESHPYAVKPSGTVVSEALGITPEVMVADFEFACKAGTAGVQCCSALVRAGDIEYGLAIGADTAQGRPGDALEYTAASGGAAFVVGRNPLAVIEGTFSYTTDTPDFWRREGEDYPRHGARFTGKPAYFHHTISAAKGLLKKLNMTKDDFDYFVFHMPNGKFPKEAAKALGFDQQKLLQSLVVEKIGNTYSGSSLLGLCAVLDAAQPGQRILLTSFGSGAGSDAFSLLVTERILEARELAPKTDFYINRKKYIDYGSYVKMRGKLKV
ncbi:MAG: hydroxymethylglutaryl-CoA synthase [Candidatus Aenigmarchaeota archaeon]|nr:hydroxymethylglutaryl-CoA synthase [Candidatus Aenigmarchaeota archaeon]